MSLNFQHDMLEQRVVFGAHRVLENLSNEVERLHSKAAMVIADERVEDLVEKISSRIDVATHFSNVVMHVPVDVVDEARSQALENNVDLLICIGGGSATGLAKAIALSTGLPIIAIPTTYAGSEATNVWGMTENEEKTTGIDNVVLPKTVIYDSALTLSLPVELTVSSGLNAIAHCVDSMWSPKTNPIVQALGAEGIRALTEGLPLVVEKPEDIDGRDLCLYGAYLSAVAFAGAGSGMHHKLCHILGGTFDLPHAQTHAIVLPYVLAFNCGFVPQQERQMAVAFGSDSALDGLNALRDKLDAPRALRDLGFTEEGIPTVVKKALAKIPDSNPRQVTEENLTELLRLAYEGAEPALISTSRD